METEGYYRGKAFVVGNDNYEQMKPDLDNAVNDAKSIYDAFQQLGFMMMDPAYDIDIDRFDELFQKFKSDLNKYEVGVLYFAGHGIEIDGKNYLIMTNTPKTDNPKSTIRYSQNLQDCIKEMHDTGCKMIIVIIDACRDNPFTGTERGWGSVNLAPIYAPQGTLIAYSTSPGERACDFGMDGHSVYTGALLNHLKEEGLEIETFFKKVRSTVNAMTGGKKTSWEHTSLIGSFSFNSGKMVQVDELGYSVTSIRDCDFDLSNKLVGKIIQGLKTYNWFDQNDAVDDFLKLRPDALNKEELFVVGRNMLQAAVGDSHYARDFILNPQKISLYTQGGQNHLLNGILFEIYFNSKGLFRYHGFKTMFLDQLLEYSTNEKLVSSFEFIEKSLKGFSHQLMFIPSVNKRMVDINVRIEQSEIKHPFNEQSEVRDCIVSVNYEGNELLANPEEDNNTFPYSSEWTVNKQELARILTEGYAIPPSRLNLVCNKELGGKQVWFDRKFKRKFKGK